jgi:predicted DNA-binding transcriptional regulator AlpA
MNRPAFYDRPLQTFHHLVFDSLMPWLPENQEMMLYRVLMTDLAEINKPFFRMMMETMHHRKVLLDEGLHEEWQLFAQTKIDKRPMEIYLSRVSVKVSHQKIAYYELLIFNALLYSQSALMELMSGSSTIMKQYYVSKWLKTIQYLRGRTRQLYYEGGRKEAILIYMTDIALLVMEYEIQALFADFCPQGLQASLLTSLNINAEIMNQDWQFATTTDHWFGTVYLARFKTAARQEDKKDTGTDGRDLAESFSYLREGENSTIKVVPKNEQPTSRPDIIPPTPQKDIIDSNEVMALLGIGKTKLFEMRKKEEIPFIKLGKLIRYYRQDILDFRDQITSKGSKADKNDY